MKKLFSLLLIIGGLAVSSQSFAGMYMDKVKEATLDGKCAGWTYTENNQTYYVGDNDGRTITWGNEENKTDTDSDGSQYFGTWSSEFKLSGERKISQNCTIPVSKIEFTVEKAKICHGDDCHSYGDWAKEQGNKSHWNLNFDGVCYKNVNKKGVGSSDEEDDSMAASPKGHSKTYIHVTKNNSRPCKWNKGNSEID